MEESGVGDARRDSPFPGATLPCSGGGLQHSSGLSNRLTALPTLSSGGFQHSGGGCQRLLPLATVQRGFQQSNAKANTPAGFLTLRCHFQYSSGVSSSRMPLPTLQRDFQHSILLQRFQHTDAISNTQTYFQCPSTISTLHWGFQHSNAISNILTIFPTLRYHFEHFQGPFELPVFFFFSNSQVFFSCTPGPFPTPECHLEHPSGVS